MPDIRDFESGELIGSQYCPLTVIPEDQTRGSSEATYLRSYLRTTGTHLQVYTHTLAKRVLFDSKKTAIGVQVETCGLPYTLTAKKEVILSAGAFQSPQLLMVSGLGPKDELAKHNITTLVDLPGVGGNMQDHVLIGVFYLVNVTTTAVLANNTIAQQYEATYRNNATGILSSNNVDFLGWEKLPGANRANISATARQALDQYPADWPDLEFVVGSFPVSPKLVSDLNYAFVETALITPQSKGSIAISSANMADPPIIDVGWLTSPTDVEVMIQALRRGRDFFAANSIQPVLIGGEAAPGPKYTTDAELAAYVRRNITTVYHASCTCESARGRLTALAT